MVEKPEYIPLLPMDIHKEIQKNKTELEVRGREHDWLAGKLRGMEFPHVKKHSKPYIGAGFTIGFRKCYIWVYGITTEMACMLAGEIEKRTGCEMIKYTNESTWNVQVEYKFKGTRDGWPITFDFVACDVEGCQVIETASPGITKKVVCS